MRHITLLTVTLLSGCSLLGTTDDPWCDPLSPLYPGLTPEQKADCESMSETGDTGVPEDAPYKAWCLRDPTAPNESSYSSCWPIERQGLNPDIYIQTDCWAVFDFDAWNYDGTCDPGNGCSDVPVVARQCYDKAHAWQVGGKFPGDVSVRLCWEDAGANGDLYPSLYLPYKFYDDEMHSPICDEQVWVMPEEGPLCVHDKGTVCVSAAGVFCSCKCETDADCESPSVCEGYYPGQATPSFCVYNEG